VRVFGVLQRIGLAYTISALLTLRTTLKQQIAVVAAILYGYWIAMALVRIPGYDVSVMPWDLKDGNLEAWLDRAVHGTNHIYQGSKTFDPEGLLSTITAACTAMLGVIAGRWIGSGRPLLDRIAGLFTAGALGLAAGLVWNWVFPINKSIWTSSYVLFTAGMAAVVLGVCMYLVDARGVRRFTRPFVVYGVNPMAAFVGSGVMARLIYSIWHVTYDGKWMPVEEAIYRALFASWASPVNASLLFALSFVLLWLGVLNVLYRRNIVLKV
jgi:predicted acyltransferase